jgi:hypothetical protein
MHHLSICTTIFFLGLRNLAVTAGTRLPRFLYAKIISGLFALEGFEGDWDGLRWIKSFANQNPLKSTLILEQSLQVKQEHKDARIWIQPCR